MNRGTMIQQLINHDFPATEADETMLDVLVERRWVEYNQLTYEELKQLCEENGITDEEIVEHGRDCI